MVLLQGVPGDCRVLCATVSDQLRLRQDRVQALGQQNSWGGAERARPQYTAQQEEGSNSKSEQVLYCFVMSLYRDYFEEKKVLI